MTRKTPQYGHPPIDMQRVSSSGELGEPGTFYWSVADNGNRTLVLMIPCNGPAARTYSRWTIDHPNHCNASWSWDGDEDKPTLNPSLHAVGIWHGCVRNGQLIEA